MNQPLDQLGRPLRDLRISLIDRCNLRCLYCMPSAAFPDGYRFLSQHDWLTFDEIERIARITALLGVRKIRLTGGEPLLRPQVENLVWRLNCIAHIEDIALTTNGIHLAAFASDLKKAGLTRLTVSLDSLNGKVYRKLSGDRGDVHLVLKGIEAAQAAGFRGIRINCVLLRGVNEEGVEALVDYCLSRGLVLRFIEYMDVGNVNHWSLDQVVTTQELVKRLAKSFRLTAKPRALLSDTAESYVVEGRGEIGFISSVTRPFCGHCARLRLSADGKIYHCLFANHGKDLKGLLRQNRDDQAIAHVVAGLWEKRDDQYSQLRLSTKAAEASPKVEMYQIGG